VEAPPAPSRRHVSGNAGATQRLESVKKNTKIIERNFVPLQKNKLK
jgi:hypothetical protein